MTLWQGEVVIEGINNLYRINESQHGGFEVETVYNDRWVRVCDDMRQLGVLWFVLKNFLKK